ncbi:MAG: ELWxxDGT repeat protein [Ginsengibacter sp.]
MRKIYKSFPILSLFLIIASSFSLHAQNFKLYDINKLTNSYPYNYQYATNSQFAILNGVMYFAANDGIHGNELFRSDGTYAGTYLVKDIVPGMASSSISDIKVSGNRLYFFAVDSTQRQKLWTSDGTAAGTVILQLNNFSHLYQYGEELSASVGTTAYFFVEYPDVNGEQFELWKTDDTGIAGNYVATVNGFPNEILGVNGRVFFTFYELSTFAPSDVFVSDGTPGGTYDLKDLDGNPATGGTAGHLTELNNQLYFSGNDGIANKLWVSDGTIGGTHTVNNTNNISLDPGVPFGLSPFGILNNMLYFPGGYTDNSTGTSTGLELCTFNTTDPAANVTFIKDIIPGNNSSVPQNYCAVNGTMFFTTQTPFRGGQLWKSDGSIAGTVLVKDIDPGEINHFDDLVNANGELLFAYSNQSLGTELWKSNGTAAGTLLVKDIFPGPRSSGVYYLTNFNNRTFFAAGNSLGTELWSTDGTASGTSLFKDINTAGSDGSDPRGFASVGNQTIFAAFNGAGNFLYSHNAKSGITRLSDSTGTVSYQVGSRPYFSTFQNDAYFVSYTNKLWHTDGTKTGTYPLSMPAFTPVDSGAITAIIATQKLLYVFVYQYYTNTNELWRTDGTPPGTYMLPNDVTGFVDPAAVIYKNELYYTGVGNAGSELWKTDGTVAGTKVVTTIGSFNYGAIGPLYKYKDKLVFRAYSANSNTPTLWISDGTAIGTYQIADLYLISNFAEVNGKLFFFGYDNSTSQYGNEVYISDGTAQGTKLLKDIYPGQMSSIFFNAFVVSGKKLGYFKADDGIHGDELWKTDGTPAGTVIVTDLTPGSSSTPINTAVNIHDHLYFTVGGSSLWQTDGTDVNTLPVQDATLAGVTQMTNLTAIGEYLYLSGFAPATSQELYVGKVNPTNSSIQFATMGKPVAEEATSFQLKLSPDPVRDILHVKVNGLASDKPALIMLITSSGTTLKTWNKASAVNTLSLDVSSLAVGVYVIKVITGGKMLHQQFIKM